MNVVIAQFDGCCEPSNPKGHAAWGATVSVDAKVVWCDSGHLGFGDGMTVNVAEYAGALAALLDHSS